MSDKYILDENGEPVLCNNLTTWSKEFKKRNMVVCQTEIGDVQVSTIFLGIDHNFTHGAPILFETMIFGGKNDQYQERYETRKDALEGHQRAIDLVRDTI